MVERFLILVVDDNENNRFLLKDLLSGYPDMDVMEASSGSAALMLCIEYDFNLILLDVQMPGMDGYETARHLQMTARTREIPIIFLTAVYKSDEFIKRGYAVGAVDYLTKPLDDNILLNRIRHYQHLKEREVSLMSAMTQMRSMQDNLIQSEKLAALGAMVAGVSHEMNAPLGNSRLALTTLTERISEVNKLYLAGNLKRSEIELFIKESGEIAALASRSIDRSVDLLATFKQVAIDQTSERKRVFDLATIVNETMTSLAPSYRHDPWQFAVLVPPGIQMDSYPGPLEQILINLVQNSIWHGFAGRDHGCITIRGTVNELYAEGKPKTVTLTVTDDGAGIAPANLDKIFEPFFTTRLDHGGSGIGLNISHRIATAILGGTITVHSELNSGTTFTLRIPCRLR